LEPRAAIIARPAGRRSAGWLLASRGAGASARWSYYS